MSDNAEEEEYQYPSYGDRGYILVDLKVNRCKSVYQYEVEVIAYEDNSCVVYIEEGVGFEYWISQHIDLELDGVYVIEGIYGIYHRARHHEEDDDEEWDFDHVRRANDFELSFGFRDPDAPVTIWK